MSNYRNNVIPINRKSAGASTGGKNVGGQFAATEHSVSAVRLGRHAADADRAPEILDMGHISDPDLPAQLERYVELGSGSEDARYYEEEFAQLLPNLNRGEVTELYLEAMDARSDGSDISSRLTEYAQRDSQAHPAGQIAEGYLPPSTTVAEDGYRQHPVVTGAKYQDTFRDSTAISKDIRADLKEAVAANYLPAGLGYSVKSRKFAGGQSIDISVQGLTDADRYEPVLTDHYGRPQERAEVKELSRRLEAFAGNYNRVDRDNFVSSYYGSVDIENDSGRAFREGEAAQRKARAVKH